MQNESKKDHYCPSCRIDYSFKNKMNTFVWVFILKMKTLFIYWNLNISQWKNWHFSRSQFGLSGRLFSPSAYCRSLQPCLFPSGKIQGQSTLFQRRSSMDWKDQLLLVCAHYAARKELCAGWCKEAKGAPNFSTTINWRWTTPGELTNRWCQTVTHHNRKCLDNTGYDSFCI